MTVSRNTITQITAVARTVPSLEAAAEFYRKALDFGPTGPPEKLASADCDLLGSDTTHVRRLDLALGSQRIMLLQFTPEGRPYPAGSTSTDLWFQHCAVVVGDMERAYEQVMRAGASPISDGPQGLPANTGGVTAFKFRDPFGHPLELLYLPPDVGDPSWHGPDVPLFLGMDHTAIAVAGLGASLGFYVDVLGLLVANPTHNQGPAQTRLDAVPADDVDVVPLAPDQTPPHLELLAYRTGTKRRLTDVAPADAAASRTFAMGDVEILVERLTQDGHIHRRGTWGDRPVVAFDDPDGHSWIVVAP